ncbi:hypothetical protein CALVIDRAFT_566646 [Calocera viscosa TUFC12733]|uniref:RING-type E3 ubiquitin transferase n=1 Tax=Calocera viscosa (strain TUFC12733) TaxID=1330018 RepID=A0A167JB47_CALVF|nr:hypothetical protein CALVIDRAFT_566646 [Calocera viscosa TUFC12733]
MADVLLRVRNALSRAASGLVSGHKLAFYGLASVGLAASAVVRAHWQYSNFYSAAVFLSRSAGSVLALANLGFFCTLIFGRIMQRIFFGPLRPSEVERLYDRIWYFLTESLLAFTIFRDEFDTPFILQFGALLFLKSFHWILGDRIEWMDQIPYPGPAMSFHVRTNVLFFVLWTADLAMLAVAVESVLENGVGGVVLFGNEYAILAATLINYMLRYLIVSYDIRRAARRGGENAPPWQDKSMWIFYTELFTDFLKLLTYLLFFIIVLTFYGLPLNIIRDVYMTARSFVTRVRDLIRYRSATRNMDSRYPNATAAELEAAGDRTCIICRDEMHAAEPGTGAAQEAAHAQGVVAADGPNMTPKKLPCGHVFHFQCLRSWLERQQSCPTCRRTVLEPSAPTPPAPQPAAAAAAAAQPAAPAPGNAPAPPGAPNAILPLMWQFGGLDPALGLGAFGAWGGALAGQPGQQEGQQLAQAQAQGGETPAPTPTTPGSTQGETTERAQEELDPRRAAAQAALRRMGIRPAESPPAVAAPPSAGPSTPPPAAQHPGLHRLHSTPALIPLFSPNSAAALPPLSFTSQQFPFQFPFSPASGSSPATPVARRGTLDPGRLSLEEMDDTLQTLERLQGVIWESVEELVRVRSRLAGLVGEEERPTGGGRGQGGGGAESARASGSGSGSRGMDQEDVRRSYYS